MTLLQGILTSSLVTGIILLIITQYLGYRKEKKNNIHKSIDEIHDKVGILNDMVMRVDARMDGIKSFSGSLENVEARISAQEIICKNNHVWDGIERRGK